MSSILLSLSDLGIKPGELLNFQADALSDKSKEGEPALRALLETLKKTYEERKEQIQLKRKAANEAQKPEKKAKLDEEANKIEAADNAVMSQIAQKLLSLGAELNVRPAPIALVQTTPTPVPPSAIMTSTAPITATSQRSLPDSLRWFVIFKTEQEGLAFQGLSYLTYDHHRFTQWYQKYSNNKPVFIMMAGMYNFLTLHNRPINYSKASESECISLYERGIVCFQHTFFDQCKTYDKIELPLNFVTIHLATVFKKYRDLVRTFYTNGDQILMQCEKFGKPDAPLFGWESTISVNNAISDLRMLIQSPSNRELEEWKGKYLNLFLPLNPQESELLLCIINKYNESVSEEGKKVLAELFLRLRVLWNVDLNTTIPFPVGLATHMAPRLNREQRLKFFSKFSNLDELKKCYEKFEASHRERRAKLNSLKISDLNPDSLDKLMQDCKDAQLSSSVYNLFSHNQYSPEDRAKLENALEKFILNKIYPDKNVVFDSSFLTKKILDLLGKDLWTIVNRFHNRSTLAKLIVKDFSIRDGKNY